jgi:hypothetical protein
MVLVLQATTWELAARGYASRTFGLSNSLTAHRLSLCHFFFEAVYRITGPVLAP